MRNADPIEQHAEIRGVLAPSNQTPPASSRDTPKVSIVVVNYDGRECLAECLSSLLATDYPDLEIVVVDNGSTDGSFEVASRTFSETRIRFLPLGENMGYAKACNRGSSVTSGEILGFLNNDVVVPGDWLSILVRTIIADSTVGAVQPKLVLKHNPDLLDAAGGFIDIFGNARERRGRASSYKRLEEVFYAKGAALLILRKLFEEIGRFDEDFFLYYEETDLCWRVWLSGHRVLLVPGSEVLHARGASTGSFDTKRETRAYLSIRLNRAVMLLKNYELRTIVRISPFLLINQAKDILILLFLGADPQAIVGTLLTPVTLLRKLKAIWAKRQVVQAHRRLGDSALIGRVILTAKPVFVYHELGDLTYRRPPRQSRRTMQLSR